MITINLTDIYLCLLKLSATIFLISVVTFCFLMVAGVDIEHDEGVWGCIAGIVAATVVASLVMLIILILVLIIYYIWKV